MIFFVFSTWIMDRPIIVCLTIKVILEAAAREIQSVGVQRQRFWHHTGTMLRNRFNQFTSDWLRLVLRQAASAFLACDPVVDVALDQEFFANGAPQSKVHRLEICLTQRNCCRHSSVSWTGCPAWTRRDSVCPTCETCVSCKRYSSKLVSNPHHPSVGRKRPGMRYDSNHHLDLSNRPLTRVMALCVSGPRSSTLGFCYFVLCSESIG